jgi:hypothetical protein
MLYTNFWYNVKYRTNTETLQRITFAGQAGKGYLLQAIRFLLSGFLK